MGGCLVTTDQAAFVRPLHQVFAELNEKSGLFGIQEYGDITPWLKSPPAAPPFVITNFVEIGAVALLAGEGGSGKSHIALQAMVAVACGAGFLGQGTLRGKAVGVFGEDSPGALYGRLGKVCRVRGVEMTSLTGRVFPMSLVGDYGDERLLWSQGKATEWLVLLEKEVAAIGGVGLLVLDNATLLADLDENVRREVAAFLRYLGGMARRLNCGVLLIHHRSKANDGTSLRMASGSTAWTNQVRVAAELVKATSDKHPSFAVRKINNGREWDCDLAWNADGALVQLDNTDQKEIHDAAFLRCLEILKKRGQHAVDMRSSQYYATKLFSGMPEAVGMLKLDHAEAMNRLLDRGTIRMAEIGKRLNRTPRHGLIIARDEVCAAGAKA